MKKSLLLVSSALAFLSLASCNNEDYKAKNFDVEEPKMDSSATVYYPEEDYQTLMQDFVYRDFDSAYWKKGEESFKKYKSVMVQAKEENEGKTVRLEKSILDFETMSLYSYTHFYGDDDSEFEVTTNAIRDGENKALYTVNTEITLKDYMFIDTIDEYGLALYKKANGTAKLTTTVNARNISVWGYTVDALGYMFYGDLSTTPVLKMENHKVYTNEDKSYVYSSLEKEHLSELFITNDYLVSYIKNTYDSLVQQRDFKYFEHSLLDTKLDSNGYTEYNYEDYHQNRLNVFPFASMPNEIFNPESSCSYIFQTNCPEFFKAYFTVE